MQCGVYLYLVTSGLHPELIIFNQEFHKDDKGQKASATVESLSELDLFTNPMLIPTI